MNSYQLTVKLLMLRYPGLFPDPLSVAIHLFSVNGNGYQWAENARPDGLTRVNGRLVDMGDYYSMSEEYIASMSMKYDDLDELAARQAEEEEKGLPDSLRVLYNDWALQLENQYNYRRWVEQNIDKIVSGLSTLSFRRSEYPSGSYVTENICTKYARGLHFPDDIQPEWAEALHDYLQWWVVALNYRYGVSHEGDGIGHWPDDIKNCRTEILAATERLRKIMGHPSQEELEKLMNDVLKDL